MAMANPMFSVATLPLLVATAVLTPTTWPAAFTEGPPEFPELIAALVCRAGQQRESDRADATEKLPAGQGNQAVVGLRRGRDCGLRAGWWW